MKHLVKDIPIKMNSLLSYFNKMKYLGNLNELITAVVAIHNLNEFGVYQIQI
jgi:hypothetical protein